MPAIRSTLNAIAVAAGLATAAALPASAQGQTGNTSPTMPSSPGQETNYFPETSEELKTLLESCDDDSCMSYVSGVISGIAVYALIAEKPSPFCTTGNVAKADIRDAILKTIDSTPQLAKQHPAIAILTAFGRYWPCVSEEEVEKMQSTNLKTVSDAALATFKEKGTPALVLGNDQAGPNRTIRVFHDPNCSHCRRFRKETNELARQHGWKVIVYPVATASEESAGYGAVEVALKDVDSGAAEAIYQNDPATIADITLAMKIAERNGVSTKTALTEISKAGAYDAIETNTRLFFDLGAKGTPTWILRRSLYSGFLTADAIVDIAATFEGAEDVSKLPGGMPADSAPGNSSTAGDEE